MCYLNHAALKLISRFFRCLCTIQHNKTKVMWSFWSMFVEECFFMRSLRSKMGLCYCPGTTMTTSQKSCSFAHWRRPFLLLLLFWEEEKSRLHSIKDFAKFKSYTHLHANIQQNTGANMWIPTGCPRNRFLLGVELLSAYLSAKTTFILKLLWPDLKWMVNRL